MVEEGNTYRLRKLTKDVDDNAVIYVDQSVMNVLKWQRATPEGGAETTPPGMGGQWSRVRL
ncbi:MULTISPECIES: hypothetical protein [unclassified Streptomyces]|uniref:hypothetical protein n=1 Tax=unclassified Streptomyces TaxID=2593676 RepID=UPI0037F71981